jgi:RNA recognition motif-containing protein
MSDPEKEENDINSSQSIVKKNVWMQTTLVKQALQCPGEAAASNHLKNRRIYIGNLSADITADVLKEFGKYDCV